MRRHLVVLVSLAGLGTFAFACKKDKAPDPGGSTTIKPEPSASTLASAKAKNANLAPLQIVATREGSIVLSTSSDGNVYAASGVALAVSRDDGELQRDPVWTTGLAVNGMGFGGGYAIDDVRFGGRFPEDAWVAESSNYGRSGSGWTVSHWENGAWKNVPNAEGKLLWFYTGFGAWKDGRTIALRLNVIPDQGLDEGAWGPLEALLAKTTPRFEVPGQKVEGLPTFTAGAAPITFASLPSGDMMALIAVGKEATTRTSVQRWPAGDTKGVVEALPGLDGELGSPTLTLASPTSAWIGGGVDGKPYLAHFDGKTWTKKDVTMKGVVVSIAESSDGTTWVITAPETYPVEPSALGELWKKGGDVQTFEPVTLPKTKFPGDAEAHLALDYSSGTPFWGTQDGDAVAGKADWFLAPRQVVVSKSGEPFVVAIPTMDEKSAPPSVVQYPGVRCVVLRPRSVPKPLELPSRVMVGLEIEDRSTTTLTTAVNKDCTVFFVDAGEIPEGSPADYDPKELREALRSLPDPQTAGDSIALEVRMQGKRHVGVNVPLCIEASCQKGVDTLMATLAKKLPAKPKLYCRSPLAVRDLKATFAK